MPSSTLCQQERPTDLLRPSSCPCGLPGDTMLLEPAGHPLGILVGVMARPAARPAQHHSMSRAGDTDGPGTHPCWASSRIPTGSEHAGSTLGLYQQPSFSADTVPRGREQAQVQSQGWGYPLPAPARGPQPSCAPSRDPPFLLPHPCSGWMYSWWPHPHCHPEPPGGRVTGRDCGDSCDSNNRTQRTGRAGTQVPGRTTWAAQPWAAPGSPKPVPPMEASSLHQPRHAHLPGLQSEPQAQLCVVNGGIAPQLFQGQSEVGQGFLEPPQLEVGHSSLEEADSHAGVLGHRFVKCLQRGLRVPRQQVHTSHVEAYPGGWVRDAREELQGAAPIPALHGLRAPLPVAHQVTERGHGDVGTRPGPAAG